MKNAVDSIAEPMAIFHLIQYFECLHAFIGFTNESALIPFIQVTGRLILFGFINIETIIENEPVILCLFIIWSSYEIIRYLYNIVSFLKRDFPCLAWLRYSIYILLLPLDVVCEGLIILNGIRHFQKTNDSSIIAGSKWHFTINIIHLTAFYMICIFLPGFNIVMKYMTKIRTIWLRTFQFDWCKKKLN